MRAPLLLALLCASTPSMAQDVPEGGATPSDRVEPVLRRREGVFSWSPPAQVDPLPDECPQAVDLIPGQPIPDGLLDEHGNVACRATVAPTSMALTLARSHAWVGQAAPRGRMLSVELRHEREVNEILRARVEEPVRWWDRPRVQHDLGFAKGIIATVALAIVVRETVRR